MSNPISQIQPATSLAQVESLQPSNTSNQAQGPSFSDVLGAALNQVNDQIAQSDQMTQALASGQAPDMHTVMIASEKATLSFQLAVQIRNKALEAYQQIMQMQM